MTFHVILWYKRAAALLPLPSANYKERKVTTHCHSIEFYVIGICLICLNTVSARISPDYPGSVRWQHFLAPHMDNIQNLTELSNYLLCGVTHLSESRLNDSMTIVKGQVFYPSLVNITDLLVSVSLPQILTM